jgi:hypothetical protein
MKHTGLEVRPMFHRAPRRIEAHVKLCVLALPGKRCGVGTLRQAVAL